MRTRVITMAVACLVIAWSFASASPSATAAGVVDIHVGSFYFEDSSVGDGVITANVGDQIRFTFDDSGGHNAQVDELGINTGVQGAGTVVVTGALTTPGTFTLYCKPHRRRGHLTTLIVSGDAPPTTAAPTTAAPTTSPPTTLAPTTTAATTTAPTTAAPTTTDIADGTAPTTVDGANDPATTISSGTSVTAVSSTTSVTPTDGATTDDAPPPNEGDHLDAVAAPLGSQTGEEAPAQAPDGGATASSPENSLLPVGVVAGEKTWLRSVWVGLFAAVPIAVLMTIAARRRLSGTI
jgi:plastocyanin